MGLVSHTFGVSRAGHDLCESDCRDCPLTAAEFCSELATAPGSCSRLRVPWRAEQEQRCLDAGITCPQPNTCDWGLKMPPRRSFPPDLETWKRGTWTRSLRSLTFQELSGSDPDYRPSEVLILNSRPAWPIWPWCRALGQGEDVPESGWN